MMHWWRDHAFGLWEITPYWRDIFSFLSDIAWPLVVAFIAYHLRKPVSEAAGNLAKRLADDDIRIGPFEVKKYTRDTSNTGGGVTNSHDLVVHAATKEGHKEVRIWLSQKGYASLPPHEFLTNPDYAGLRQDCMIDLGLNKRSQP